MWPLLGGFWALSPPNKYGPISLKFLPEVISDKAEQRQFINNLSKYCLK